MCTLRRPDWVLAPPSPTEKRNVRKCFQLINVVQEDELLQMETIMVRTIQI